MSEFKISVIIPSYNSASTIVRALDSVIQQTFSPFEIIVIDDASKDRTFELLNDYKIKNEKQLNILIIKNEINSGPSHSRNRGIEASKGNWIAFLDSDDYWHPRKLEIQVKLLYQHKAKMIGSIVEFHSKDASSTSTEEIKTITSFDMLWKNYFQTPTVLIQKSQSLKFNTGMSYAEDFDLWSRMIRDFGNGLYMNHPFTYLGKAPYLKEGLSSNLFDMQLGEVHVLQQERNPLLRLAAITFSFIKFSRRLFLAFLNLFSKAS